MNKLVKGSIAGAAGIALLLGGAGTFALWNSTETMNVGAVSAGTLTIDAAAAGTWKNVSSDAPAGGEAIANIADYRIVPGDRLEFVQTVTIDATGDNLDATLTLVPTSISGALLPFVDIDVAVAGDTIDEATAPGVYTISADSATPSTATITATVELPADVTGETAQGATLDLSAIQFALQQTRA
ncbi:alternate-type signal peptide domain-containing protein [Marisediminicola sp. LYQ134]|uniref:alternate-type signal peptide domain-containing protein n=1 Tax=unclassified Marisediminicola TaxID=2618316 RepID=UPI003983859B